MGDGVVDDKDLVISVAGEQAGGNKGRVLMESVNLQLERSNDPVTGIGNESPQAMKYGNETYSMSTEQHLNEAAANIVVSLYRNSAQPSSAFIRANGVLESRVAKLDWNNVEWDSSDDGDVTISIDADLRGVKLDGPDELGN